MPINSFSGKAYVAFSDLNGFKEMMRSHERAAKALDKFYRTVYSLISEPQYSGVQTLAVSDCAISFIGNEQNRDSLPLLLGFLQKLHSEMIKADYLVTSSVAYGQFSYHERIELSGLEKNMFLGDAYLKSYLINGKCPDGSIIIICDDNEKDNILQSSGAYRDFMKCTRRREIGGLQYYWAVSSAPEIDKFAEAYQDTYRLKYKGMISIYKEYSGRRQGHPDEA